MARILINAGADPKRTDMDGELPIDLAKFRGSQVGAPSLLCTLIAKITVELWSSLLSLVVQGVVNVLTKIDRVQDKTRSMMHANRMKLRAASSK